MSRVFFTADTHFGHSGIIGMCNRPFENIEHHDRALIENWNAVVEPDDTVWFLGDFAYRTRPQNIRRIFDMLHGTKQLICGNHDHGKPGKVSATRQLPWASQHEQTEVTAEDGTTLVLNHYSLRVWRNMRRGAVQLYGHSHGNLPGTRQCIDVGVDNFGYAPVTWPQIKARLELLPALDFRPDTDEVEQLKRPEPTPADEAALPTP